MPEFRPTVSIRILVMSVSVVAASMAWSGHFSDCKHQAAMHAVAALENRWRVRTLSMSDQARSRQGREAAWHDAMSRRFEQAAWSPWPFPPTPLPDPE